ncbi:7628_t:CDS:2, partial [Funneliformis mosseae]
NRLESLQQAFLENNNKPFSKRSVIMFRDFSQLPPVLDLLMYTKVLRDSLSNNGLAAYILFKEVYKLDVVQRQFRNSQEQQDFRFLLLRLRDRESTLADWRTLTT